jgi:hypothetical protein
MVVVVDEIFEASLVVNVADLLMAGGTFIEMYEVAVLEAGLELTYPDEGVTMAVAVTQLVIATWHGGAEVALEKMYGAFDSEEDEYLVEVVIL